mmetsp:Transcript_19767/g.24410  ORF Transcript_19767/g.24410 Transcript_19767/m.24410 type:complete len:109 (+) Transcript_19767:364-690(+)
MLEWHDNFFETIEHLLPPKFFVFAASASASAYPIGLWVCKHPNRVEKLFFASPCGVEPQGPVPDIYKRRITPERREYFPKKLVDKWVYNVDILHENYFAPFSYLPRDK